MRVGRFVQSAQIDEGNVCGVIVHSRPENRTNICEALIALPGVEIHHTGDDGRLIVTVEDTAQTQAAPTIERFHDIHGILSVALVYHHFASDLQGETFP